MQSPRTTMLSPLPWTWRPYEDSEAFLALCDARGNELGFIWIASEDAAGLADIRERVPHFLARPRVELERNLTAICAIMNAPAPSPASRLDPDTDPWPATPRPWRVLPGRGHKDEPVLSIVSALGHDDEILCWQRDHQTEIDFAAIVDAVNTRWP